MADEGTQSVLSAAELEAAIAEAETRPASGSLPIHAEAQEKHVVPVPVHPPEVGHTRPTGAEPEQASGFVAQAEGAPPDATSPPQTVAVGDSAAHAPSRPGFFCRVASFVPFIRRRHQTAEAPAEDSPGKPGLLYRAVDALLAVINRPFAALGPTVRDTIGVVGLVTLAISILAGTVLPYWMAPPDPVTTIRQKLERKPPPAHAELSAEPEAASHNSH